MMMIPSVTTKTYVHTIYKTLTGTSGTTGFTYVCVVKDRGDSMKLQL